MVNHLAKDQISGEVAHLAFRKSSFCGGGECVEVVTLSGGIVAVRDSKGAEKPLLLFTKKEWSEFIKGVKAGEFEV